MVSVILPNYNYQQYLNQRIDSILNQTYGDFELLIFDDHSTDNSLDIIHSYSDKRIKVFENTKNSGNPFFQWKKGINKAKYDLIWIAEADDYCETSLLEKCIRKITEFNSDVCYCDSNIVDELGNNKGIWSQKKLNEMQSNLFKNDFAIDGLSFIKEQLIFKNTIPNASAVIFKKESYLDAGGVNPNLRNCADWLLYLNILKDGSVTFISDPLNYFRRHGNSVISNSLKKSEELSHYHESYSFSMRKLIKKHFPKDNLIEKQIHAINNEFISKELYNKILWSKKNEGHIKALKLTFEAFKTSGYHLRYFKRYLES